LCVLFSAIKAFGITPFNIISSWLIDKKQLIKLRIIMGKNSIWIVAVLVIGEFFNSEDKAWSKSGRLCELESPIIDQIDLQWKV